MLRSLCRYSVVLLLPLAAAGQSYVTNGSLSFVPRGVGDVDADGVDDYSNTSGTTGGVLSGATGLPITQLAFTPMNGGYWHAGDVDADGHDDVVRLTGNAAASVARVVSGASGAVLHTWNGPAVGTSFSGAARGADIDGDGCSDVLLIAFNMLEVYSGRTGGLLHSAPISTLDPLNPTEVAVGDWNGDGASDIAITTPILSNVVLRLGPNFTPVTVAGGFLGSQPTRALGDIAGNGKSAIASQVLNPGQVTLLDGLNGPVVGTVPTTTVWNLGDVDGDGRDDFVGRSPVFQPGIDGLYSGRTLTQFSSTVPAWAIGMPGIGDVDGDGRQDNWSNTGAAQIVFARWVDPTLPVASRVVRRGASGATTSGRRPRLHARGLCNLGSTLRVDARGLLANGISVLAFGDATNVDLAPAGAPGNRLYTSIANVSLLPTDARGIGLVVLAIPSSAALLGATVSLQAAAWDPTANALGLVTSNALDLAVNN